MERFGPDAGDGRDAVSDRLDYASREGKYSGKGAARMTDASLWGSAARYRKTTWSATCASAAARSWTAWCQ